MSNNIDTFYILETFLDSSVDNIHDRLNINGYTLVRIDHSYNTKHGGVSIYYKDHLPVFRGNYISSLNESMVLEICLTKNKFFLTVLCRSPSPNKDQFDEFCSRFNILMTNTNAKKPSSSIVTGGINDIS